jgi:predicted nucleotidyltransferase
METEDLLKLLNDHKVKYVIIGATAFPVHGYVRATLDIDIFIEATAENGARILQALSDFGYDVADLTMEDVLEKKILIREYAVETDIHPFVKGTTFQEVWRTRIKEKYGKTPTYFANLENLIKMKKAAGRVKDLEDLKYLERLLQKKDKNQR